MRVIHCADLHLDSAMTTHFSKEIAKQRNAEILRTFVRMVEFAHGNGIQVILIAGDLFDRKRVSAQVRHMVEDTIRRFEDISFFYLRGNHDGDHFLETMKEFPENLLLFDEDWTYYHIGSTVICGREPSGADSVFSAPKLREDRVNIVMLHGQIVDGYREETGGERIMLPLLRDANVDYLALGHIHEYSEGRLDGRGSFCYPGCLEGRGFDECGDHGFVVLEIDEQQRAITRRGFVPFAGRRLWEVSADISGLDRTGQIVRCVGETLRALDISQQDLVKIQLVGLVDVECEKNLTYIQKYFAEDYFFVKVEDRTTLHVDPTAFLYDESLKGEFVRLVMNSELSEEEQSEVIRYGLQSLKDEEVRL